MKILNFAPFLLLLAADPIAQELNCRDFQRILNGSWMPIKQILVLGPVGNVAVGPGTSFDPGIPFKGIDFATLLNAKCSNPPPL